MYTMPSQLMMIHIPISCCLLRVARRMEGDAAAAAGGGSDG